MRKRKIGCALCVAVALSSPAFSQGARVFPTSDKPALTDVYPDRVTHWPGGVTSLADVTYAVNTGYRPQIVDIYLPPKSGELKPLILYIHGGGWLAGHTRHNGALSNFPAVLASLAREGFVVASLEYRLSSEAKFPAQLQDARAALRFLRAHAPKYGLDPARVGLWGGSAGGHLAALTGLTCGVAKFDVAPAAAGSECAQAVVTWYGVFDATPMVQRGLADPMVLELGCVSFPCPADKVADVSPDTFITANGPPFLLIHGDDDKTVPVTQSKDAYVKMTAVGMNAHLVVLPGVDHSFIGHTPAETRTATLKAVNATFDFFHATLDRKAK